MATHATSSVSSPPEPRGGVRFLSQTRTLAPRSVRSRGLRLTADGLSSPSNDPIDKRDRQSSHRVFSSPDVSHVKRWIWCIVTLQVLGLNPLSQLIFGSFCTVMVATLGLMSLVFVATSVVCRRAATFLRHGYNSVSTEICSKGNSAPPLLLWVRALAWRMLDLKPLFESLLVKNVSVAHRTTTRRLSFF